MQPQRRRAVPSPALDITQNRSGLVVSALALFAWGCSPEAGGDPTGLMGDGTASATGTTDGHQGDAADDSGASETRGVSDGPVGDAGSSSGAPDDDGAAETDSDTDSADDDGDVDGDSDAGSETSTGGETGAPGDAGPCPPYAGLGGVGSTWDTTTTAAYEAANGFSQDTHREVTTVQPGTPTRITVVATTTATGPDYSATTVTTSGYACDDDGAWLEDVHSESQGVSAGTPFDVSSDSTYAPAWLAMPWDVEPGTTWVASSTITTTTVNGPVQNAVSQSYEVTGTDSVATPAGNFDVLVFSWSGSGASGSWFGHQDVGGIGAADGAYELLDYEIAGW